MFIIGVGEMQSGECDAVLRLRNRRGWGARAGKGLIETDVRSEGRTDPGLTQTPSCTRMQCVGGVVMQRALSASASFGCVRVQGPGHGFGPEPSVGIFAKMKGRLRACHSGGLCEGRGWAPCRGRGILAEAGA